MPPILPTLPIRHGDTDIGPLHPSPCLFALAVTAIGSRRRQERMIAPAMIDSMTRLGATMLRNAHQAVGVPSSFVSRSRRVARPRWRVSSAVGQPESVEDVGPVAEGARLLPTLTSQERLVE